MTYLLIIGCMVSLQAQQPGSEPEPAKDRYLSEQKVLGQSFSAYFYPNYASVHRLSEDRFVEKIDSTRSGFFHLLKTYCGKLDPAYVAAQQREIKYYFDKLLIEYPVNHETYSGSGKGTYPIIERMAAENQDGFNNPALLADEDFIAYAKSFLSFRMRDELTNEAYDSHYSRYLDAWWNLISRYVTNRQCRNFWRYDALADHISTNGAKGIDHLADDFRSTCSDTAYLQKLQELHQQSREALSDHLIEEYKKVGNYGLDIHIFLPESAQQGAKPTGKRPIIVYFHGGSWSEGQPAWHFDACRRYAQQGWIACAVEYRVYGKQGTLPFEAAKDARSAVRWLRAHGESFNADTGRIVATGNSAGGHLVLAAAMADRWNEQSDPLAYSPVPNAMLVNSGVYDLTDEKTAWIRRDLENKDQAKEISPLHLGKANLPPLLMIHGAADQNAPYFSAKAFAEQAASSGSRVEFKTIADAGHFIFTDPRYIPQVNAWRRDFLLKLGYPDNNGE